MLKVGIIGSGFGLYGLLPAFNSIKGCKVVSICGKKSDRLLDYCQKIGLKNIYTDWQDMLDKEELDILAIAVTPIEQYGIAKVAIGMGINIFAEKPLANSPSQAKELLDLAIKKKIHHAIDFIFPEIEEWKKVKKMIDKQSLGKLKSIEVSWDFLSYDIANKKLTWKTDSSQGGGALSFYFSHTLYYLEYFAGRISDLKSTLSYSKQNLNRGEVGVQISLKFKNGTEGHAHLNCDTPGINKHQLKFIFEKGTIVLENRDKKIVEFTIETFTPEKGKQIILPKKYVLEHEEDERVKIVRKLATKFINSCTLNKIITPSFREGVRVQELIEEIRKQQL